MEAPPPPICRMRPGSYLALAHLQVVQQLKDEPELGSLHRMLQIMASETYAEYLTFAAEPKAKAMLAKLSAQNRFALAFRTHNMKTEAGRKKKIETFVAMLKRGETIYPQSKK